LSSKAVHNWAANVSLMTKRLKRRCGNGWNNNQKTSMLQVSTHCWSDGTGVSMLMDDMSINNCFNVVNVNLRGYKWNEIVSNRICNVSNEMCNPYANSYVTADNSRPMAYMLYRSIYPKIMFILFPK
jgi:hypothetical protein